MLAGCKTDHSCLARPLRIAQPLTVKNRTLRNRIVMPPMATGKSDNGAPSKEMIEYYAERADATAMIIVEHEYVSPEGRASKGQLSIAEESVIPAYQELTDAVRQRGAVILAQISHAGAAARDSGFETLAPSPFTLREGLPAPKEMTEADIRRVVRCFADAAVRARKSGFDGVEIHSAHGYLLNQFYSPLTNHRTDAYSGASIEGRTKLHADIIRAVREAAGEDFLVALRFGACDYMEGGSTLEEIPAACRIFEAAGIDLLDISGGHCFYTRRGITTPGWFADSSLAARRGTTVPILLTGGITTGQEAEGLLRRGAADLIGVGRSMIQNAGWTQEALAGDGKSTG